MLDVVAERAFSEGLPEAGKNGMSYSGSMHGSGLCGPGSTPGIPTS